MVSLGLSTEEARKVWQPFLDWIARSPGVYTVEPGMILGSMPARHWWDVAWRKEQHQHVFDSDARPGASEKDRKSTRLNSSHGYISYAVFCLKKKKTSPRHCSEQATAQGLARAARAPRVRP